MAHFVEDVFNLFAESHNVVASAHFHRYYHTALAVVLDVARWFGVAAFDVGNVAQANGISAGVGIHNLFADCIFRIVGYCNVYLRIARIFFDISAYSTEALGRKFGKQNLLVDSVCRKFFGIDADGNFFLLYAESLEVAHFANRPEAVANLF